MGGEENAEETLPPLTAAEEKMYGRVSGVNSIGNAVTETLVDGE